MGKTLVLNGSASFFCLEDRGVAHAYEGGWPWSWVRGRGCVSHDYVQLLCMSDWLTSFVSEQVHRFQDVR